MSQFSALLEKGAGELRDYCQTSPEAKEFGVEWLQALAQRMEFASSLKSDAEVEREIAAIAYALCDSGPSSDDCAPSFMKALDALQRLRKRRPIEL
jgi:hypothetical protein